MAALFKSDLLSWNEQRYIVTGILDSNVAEKNLYCVLEKELITHSKEVVSRIQERLQLSTDAEKRTKFRLKDVQNLQEKWQEKVNEMKEEYNEVGHRLELANKDLEKNVNFVKINSDEIRLLREELNELCNMRECYKICQKSRSCSACWKDFIAEEWVNYLKACHTTELASSHRFPTDGSCTNEICKPNPVLFHQFKDILISSTFLILPFTDENAFSLEKSVRNVVYKCQVREEKCAKDKIKYQYTHSPYNCNRRHLRLLSTYAFFTRTCTHVKL